MVVNSRRFFLSLLLNFTHPLSILLCAKLKLLPLSSFDDIVMRLSPSHPPHRRINPMRMKIPKQAIFKMDVTYWWYVMCLRWWWEIIFICLKVSFFEWQQSEFHHDYCKRRRKRARAFLIETKCVGIIQWTSTIKFKFLNMSELHSRVSEPDRMQPKRYWMKGDCKKRKGNEDKLINSNHYSKYCLMYGRRRRVNIERGRERSWRVEWKLASQNQHRRGSRTNYSVDCECTFILLLRRSPLKIGWNKKGAK